MRSEGQLWILVTGEHLPSDDCCCSSSHNTWRIRDSQQTFAGGGEYHYQYILGLNSVCIQWESIW